MLNEPITAVNPHAQILKPMFTKQLNKAILGAKQASGRSWPAFLVMWANGLLRGEERRNAYAAGDPMLSRYHADKLWMEATKNKYWYGALAAIDLMVGNDGRSWYEGVSEAPMAAGVRKFLLWAAEYFPTDVE